LGWVKRLRLGLDGLDVVEDLAFVLAEGDDENATDADPLVIQESVLDHLWSGHVNSEVVGETLQHVDLGLALGGLARGVGGVFVSGVGKPVLVGQCNAVNRGLAVGHDSFVAVQHELPADGVLLAVEPDLRDVGEVSASGDDGISFVLIFKVEVGGDVGNCAFAGNTRIIEIAGLGSRHGNAPVVSGKSYGVKGLSFCVGLGRGICQSNDLVVVVGNKVW